MSSTLREACKETLQVDNKTYHYYSLARAAEALGDLSRLPKSLKVLLENLATRLPRRIFRRWPAGFMVPMRTEKLPIALRAC